MILQWIVLFQTVLSLAICEDTDKIKMAEII